MNALLPQEDARLSMMSMEARDDSMGEAPGSEKVS
jgi:hypothetical protein